MEQVLSEAQPDSTEGDIQQEQGVGGGVGHPGELLLSSSMLTRMVMGCSCLTSIVIVLRGSQCSPGWPSNSVCRVTLNSGFFQALGSSVSTTMPDFEML